MKGRVHIARTIPNSGFAALSGTGCTAVLSHEVGVSCLVVYSGQYGNSSTVVSVTSMQRYEHLSLLCLALAFSCIAGDLAIPSYQLALVLQRWKLTLLLLVPSGKTTTGRLAVAMIVSSFAPSGPLCRGGTLPSVASTEIRLARLKLILLSLADAYGLVNIG
jgi:hypothetical protein